MTFIERSGLEQEYIDITGTTCKICGSHIVVNENFTIVKCINPHCPRKLEGQIQKIISQTEVKGYGPETISRTVRSYGYRNVTDFLMQLPADLADPVTGLIQECNTLTTAIQLLSLPTFDVLVGKMFDNFNTYDAFLKYVDEKYNGDIEIACMEFYGTGITSRKVNDILHCYAEDLYNVDVIFDFNNEVNEKIKDNIVICISGEVSSEILRKYYSGKITKKVAVQLLNLMFNEKGFKFTLAKDFTKAVDYLLRDEMSDSNKSRAAKRRDVCFSTDEFIHKVLNTIKEEQE